MWGPCRAFTAPFVARAATFYCVSSNNRLAYLGRSQVNIRPSLIWFLNAILYCNVWVSVMDILIDGGHSLKISILLTNGWSFPSLVTEPKGCMTFFFFFWEHTRAPYAVPSEGNLTDSSQHPWSHRRKALLVCAQLNSAPPRTMYPQHLPPGSSHPATSTGQMPHYSLTAQGTFNGLLASSAQGFPASSYFYAPPYGRGPRGDALHQSASQTGMFFGQAQVYLCNRALWLTFHRHQTEMIITKQGR